ncbi:MAG: hypothetical protein P8Z36_03945 [Gemmatimonadota bacterium]
MAQETASEGGPARRRAPAWPPPGLEAIQGRLWTAIALLAAGGVVMSLPVLVAAASSRPFWSLGPFGEAWWAPATAAGLGMVAALAGFDRLFRLLWLGANSARDGHDWRTIFAVAADTGDTGHLLAGTAQFSRTAPRERRWTLIARLTGGALALVAALWLPVGLAVSMLLAANAGLGSMGAWALTLAPTGILALAALLSRALERSVVGGAERSWRAHQPAELELRTEIDRWNREAAAALERAGDPSERPPITTGPESRGPGVVATVSRAMRAGALATLVMGPLVVLLVGTFAIASAIGPVLGTLGNTPALELPRQALRVEPLRALRVRPDSAITPQAAARELTAVLAVGRRARAGPYTPAPDRTYPEHWFPDDNTGGMGPGRYAGLFQRVAEGLTPEQRNSLARVANHPAQARFSRLARAPTVDVAAARWVDPLPDTLPWIALEQPGGDIWSAARAHVVRAAYLMDQGRNSEAETALREVVSVGFLLLDDGPTLNDAARGITVIRDGARGLENFYRATGQDRLARQVADEVALGIRMARYAAAVAPQATPLRGIPALVLDPEALRALRWNRFATLATIGPCLNPHNAIFGPDRDYHAWLARADSALVRWPSEAQIFRHRQYGDLVAPNPRPNAFVRILGVTFGGSRPGSCAALLGSTRRR